MAEWWEAAPLAQGQATDFSSQRKPQADDSWWQSAPLAQEAMPASRSGATRVTIDTGAIGKPPAPPAGQDRGAIDAAARGVATGLTANFYDELRGLVEAGGAKEQDPASLLGLIQGIYKKTAGSDGADDRYNAAVTRERELTKTAEEQHPVASIAGNIAGAVALPVGGALSGPLRRVAWLEARR